MKIKSYLKAVFAIAALAAGTAGVISYTLFSSTVKQPAGIAYNLRQGLGKKTFVNELYTQNIIRHPWLYNFYISFFPRSQLKAGEYLFPKGASPASIWRQVTTGTGQLYHPFTIIPGWNFAQLKQALAQTNDIKHVISSMSDKQIMSMLGAPDVAPEGEFYPETYYYLKDSPDLVILKRAYNLMQKKLNTVWAKRSPDLIFKSPYEVLIAASIVEKEAYLSSERPIIAGVLVNRLKNDMLLQFDPTVIYGMGDGYQGKIHKIDLQTDTPYNTYIHKGLPPTPIAMPGMSSINAVLHPAVHNYFYFVARGDGSHQFSETLLEHNSAVALSNNKNESKKDSSVNYVNPLVGQKYLQNILTTNTARRS